MKIPQYIKDRFGGTLKEIQTNKSTGKQRRVCGTVAAPIKVTITQDELKVLLEKAGVEYKAHDEERILRYIFSDETVDRMGDIIRQSGWQLKNYKKNAVILIGHNSRELPIGAGLNVKVIDKKLMGDVLFANEDTSMDAEKAFKMASAGFFKANSVGFMPIEVNNPSDEEREKLGLGPFGVEFKKQELLEDSLVSVPANPEAVQAGISKGLVELDFFKDIYDEETFDKLKIDVKGTKSVVVKKPEETVLKASAETIKFDYDNDEFKKALAKAIDEMTEEKAGAVLSKKNKDKLNKLTESLEKAVDIIKGLLEDANDAPEEENILPEGLKAEDFNLEDDDTIKDIDYSILTKEE